MDTIDTHVRTAPLHANLPVILGLIGVWYIDLFGAETHALLAYNDYLSRFSRLRPAACPLPSPSRAPTTARKP